MKNIKRSLISQNFFHILLNSVTGKFNAITVVWVRTYSYVSPVKENRVVLDSSCYFPYFRRILNSYYFGELGSYAVSTGKLLPTFRDYLSVTSSGFKNTKQSMQPHFFFLALQQPPLGVVFYSPVAGFSLPACEVS